LLMRPNEAKVLELWLRGVDGQDRGEPAAARAFAVVTYVSLFLLFLAVFQFARYPLGWWLVLLVVAAVVVGAALMAVLIRRQGRSRLEYLLPHLNIESMRARLAELEA
jgi:hypothetical protein